MAKWNEAWYQNADGSWSTFPHQELNNASRLATARALELWSDRHQTHRLYPRRNGHFYAITEDRRPIVMRDENDPLHNQRVEEFRQWFKERAVIILGHHCAEEGFVNELVLRNYSWETEVHQMSEKESFRHDIVGRSSALSDSINRPSLIIEVIHRHFPSNALFDHMLVESRRKPVRYLFDLAEKRNYLLSPGRNGEDSLQYTICIREGAVWNGSRKTEICTPQFFNDYLARRLQQRVV